MLTDLILGTAGNIYHGKTSLIRAVTGANTDRLPEEKKRGITIELGFALLELEGYRMGIVDVPGHEKFVRNMLAGATGMDVAMLVVAADDSIKQQTREHLEILRMLNLPAGVIVITKVDLVEADWVDLVEEEVKSLVQGSFLEDAQVLRTSSHTGEGIDDLKEALQLAGKRVTQSGRLTTVDSPFRMPIDRTFAMEGHGTVVTGSVATGKVNVGDELLVQPGNVQVRVRSLQNHMNTVEQVHRGQRAAINLAGIHHNETQRGQELTAKGHLVPSKRITVNLVALKELIRPIKDRSRARLHVGSAEIICNVRLLDRDELGPGNAAPAQLFLNDPVVTTWNQPFVLRSESPVSTIGGGQVLDPDACRIQHPDAVDLKMIQQLQAENPVDRASAALFFAQTEHWTAGSLSRTAGIRETEKVYQELKSQSLLQEVQISPTRKLCIHVEVIQRLVERVSSALRKQHDLNTLCSMIDRKSFLSGFAYLGSEALVLAVIQQMKSDGLIRLSSTGIGLTGCGPKLSKNEQALLNNIVSWFRGEGLAPPTIADCEKRATKNKESVSQLVTLAVNNGDLVEIAQDLFLHSEVLEKTKKTLRDLFRDHGKLTMADIRDCLKTSRKYAVPLCEYLDGINFTEREGDLRSLKAS
ncbi:MAG: selenocysteine-specific translation elongation factor [Planctomycetota bacterium]|nr:selenocysteine-specific translation elongation factor [Planctomycetota bacterium]